MFDQRCVPRSRNAALLAVSVSILLHGFARSEGARAEAGEYRVAELHLPARQGGSFTIEAMRKTLADPDAGRWERIRAALGLSWRRRVDSSQPVDVPCLDLANGAAQFMIMPAESFVGYQLIAQRLRPDSFVVVAGFGDGAAGYIPTDTSWRDGYHDDYCWVGPMTEELMTRAMAQALKAESTGDRVRDRPRCRLHEVVGPVGRLTSTPQPTKRKKP